MKEGVGERKHEGPFQCFVYQQRLIWKVSVLVLIFLSHMTMEETEVWSPKGLMGLIQPIRALSEPVEILSAHTQLHVPCYTLFAGKIQTLTDTATVAQMPI